MAAEVGAGARQRFQDVFATIEHNVESGDTSVNRYTLSGTHSASGLRYEILGIDMVRVRNGKVVEHWALLDSVAMQDQLEAKSAHAASEALN